MLQLLAMSFHAITFLQYAFDAFVVRFAGNAKGVHSCELACFSTFKSGVDLV